jgi:predicted O-methyltransferase YrrM
MKTLVQLAINNKAQQKPLEFEELLHALNSMKSKKIAVEIGSYDGGCLHAYKGLFDKVISIDMSQRSNIDGVDYLIGDSKELKAELIKALGNSNAKIDFLMIDGDHTYEGVKADYEIYSKFVRKGGVIAFHDIIDTPLHRELFCRVDKFWNEIKDGKEHDEFIEGSDWGGIGILWI